MGKTNQEEAPRAAFPPDYGGVYHVRHCGALWSMDYGKEEHSETYSCLSPALETPHHDSHSDWYGESPVCGHYINIGRGEVKADMEEHIEQEHGHHHPHQPLTPPIPHSRHKEDDNKRLDDVVEGIGVPDEYRTVAVGILQRVFLVQYESLAEDILCQRWQAVDVILCVGDYREP